MYDLLWVVDGRVREVILYNTPLAICRWKANKQRSTTHKIGLLQPRKTELRPKGGWS